MKSTMRYVMHTLLKNCEPEILLDTTLVNYTKLKSTVRNFEKVPKFLVSSTL